MCRALLVTVDVASWRERGSAGPSPPRRLTFPAGRRNIAGIMLGIIMTPEAHPSADDAASARTSGTEPRASARLLPWRPLLPGIAPEFHEQAFMIFQRLHDRKKYPGAGIGLAMCKKIVEQRGGTIAIEAQPGQGAAVSFTVTGERAS